MSACCICGEDASIAPLCAKHWEEYGLSSIPYTEWVARKAKEHMHDRCVEVCENIADDLWIEARATGYSGALKCIVKLKSIKVGGCND